jgi:flagellar motor protein MotB
VLDRDVYPTTDYELSPTKDNEIYPATHSQIYSTTDDEIHFATHHGVSDELRREIDHTIFDAFDPQMDHEVYPVTPHQMHRQVRGDIDHTILDEVDHRMDHEAYPATPHEVHDEVYDEVHPEIDHTILEAVDREMDDEAYAVTPHEMHDEAPRDMRHEINLAIPGEVDHEMNHEARPETAVGPHSLTLPEESPPPEAILAASDQTRTESQVETILREIFSPAGDRVEIQARPGSVTVRLRDTVTFRSGSADLLPEVRPLLDQVAQLLVARPEIRVETAGHTDELPISSTVYPSNWELSAARAAAVARYLLDRTQIDPQRIEIAGYGEYRPVDTRPTLEGRARNRRVEIRFVHPLPDDSLT